MAQGLAAPLLDCNLQAFAIASEIMVAMKAMKAGARAMTGGDLTKKIAESTQLKTKDVKGVFAALRTIAYAEVKKTEKFRHPAAHDAQAEAQARTQGRHEGDVREG